MRPLPLIELQADLLRLGPGPRYRAVVVNSKTADVIQAKDAASVGSEKQLEIPFQRRRRPA